MHVQTTPRAKARKPAAKRGHAPTELSREAIRGAALVLIDQDGLPTFSTRKLGRALGCEAMAIYWYYPSKDALLDAVVDQLVAPVGGAAVADAADWIGALRQIAHAYRRIAHDHPHAFPLLATRRFASEGSYAFLDQVFALARLHAIPDRTAAQFYRVVSSYCSGFALNELAARPDPKAPSTAALRKRFPRVAEVSAWLEPQHLDEIFDFGLEILLQALARTETERRRKR